MGVADDSAAFFEVCIYKYVCMDGWMMYSCLRMDR